MNEHGSRNGSWEVIFHEPFPEQIRKSENAFRLCILVLIACEALLWTAEGGSKVRPNKKVSRELGPISHERVLGVPWRTIVAPIRFSTLRT